MFSRSHGMREYSRKLLVIITDGASADGEATVKSARLTRDEGNAVMVGVGFHRG